MSAPIQIFAAKNKSPKIVKESSSGGVFSTIADAIINDGGVVFGAKWDKEWTVIHSFTETTGGISEFRSSKYIQSKIGSTYREAKEFLLSGRKVLFSGTPCQIAGLNNYLKSHYENLFCIECICHGTPSPTLWKKYLREISKGREVSAINFRDKTYGWQNYHVVYKFSDGTQTTRHHDDDPWIKGMIHNLNLRSSCYSCNHKISNTSADITLGDFWGAEDLIPHINDDKGISLVIVNTEKGQSLVKDLTHLKDFSLNEVSSHNKSLIESAQPNKELPNFLADIEKGETYVKSIKRYTKERLFVSFKRKIAAIFS